MDLTILDPRIRIDNGCESEIVRESTFRYIVKVGIEDRAVVMQVFHLHLSLPHPTCSS